MKRQLRDLATTEPDLAELKHDWNDAVMRRDRNIFSRQRINYRARYCVWANQSDDGKKWSAPKGQQPFPWLGASDARVQLVDKYINEDVAFLMVVASRMRTIVSGTEINDAGFAHRMTHLLRWMKNTQMGELRRELRLAANYMLERGTAVIGVFWDRQTQMGYTTLDAEGLIQMSMQAQQRAAQGEQLTPAEEQLATLPELLMDPSREKQALAAFAAAFPNVRSATIKRALRELMTQGSTTFPMPYMSVNRPCVVALAPNEDVFIPSEATDLETARGIYRREVLTEAQLVDRERTHGWDRKWITQVINTQRGKMTLEWDTQVLRANQRVTSGSLLAMENLFEVAHAYRRMADEDGVPGIYYTCFSPGVTTMHAYHGLLGYDHGQQPFTLLERENRTRLVEDSRGYGEVAFTWQNQIKTQWDARVDRASLATLPPAYYPSGQPPDKWGPGVKVPTVSPEDYGFLDIPKYDPGSNEVEESVRRFADEYFGRPVDEQNMVQAQVMRQELANHWMHTLAKVDTQILKLMQQFMPDQIYYRVVGSSQAKPLHTTRDEIQGQFDVTVGYNIADLDNEVVTAKLGLIEKALMMDTTGRVDRNAALDVIFQLIDPDIGERVLRPALDASQSEIEDEQTVFTKMMAGVPVDVKPEGQAYDLRLKVLENLIQINPKAQKEINENEYTRSLFERRFKQLEFQQQQRENAIIGRLGA